MSVFPKCACEVKDFPSIQSFLGYFKSRIVNFWHIKAKYLAPQLLDFGFTGGGWKLHWVAAAPPVNMLKEALPRDIGFKKIINHCA